MPMVLRWTPTAEDLSDAWAAQGPRRPMPPSVRFGVAGAALAVGAVLLLLGHLTAATVGAAVAVAVVLAGGRAAERRPGRVLTPRRTLPPQEAVLTPDGLRVADTTLPWAAFTRAVETERSFVLLGPRRRGLPLLTYLPKRAADADALRGLLARVVTPR